MRALVAITVRELRERWTLPLATFCFGFVPLALAWREGERAVPVGVLAAVPTAWALALMLGTSVIARDLGDGRLRFFFARPVPWWAIAGGKLLAALLLTLATAFTGALPSLLAEAGQLGGYAASLRDAVADGRLALLLILLIGLIALGHAASVVYRARSAWAAADFVLLAAAGFGGVWLFRAFARIGAVMSDEPPGGWGLALRLLLVALVPLAATAAQVAYGRSELRRGHLALSIVFWSGALVWFAALGGLLSRELGIRPGGLAARTVTGAGPDGRFVSLLEFDPKLRRTAVFLYDTGSGRFLRRPQLWSTYSADGRFFAWVEEAPAWFRSPRSEVRLVRLDAPDLAVEAVELAARVPPDAIRGLALSPRGDRLAILRSAMLSVHELPSGRTLSQISSADGSWMAAAFLPDGELRAFRRVLAVVGAPGSPVVPGRIDVVPMSGGVPSGAIRLEAVGHAVLISPPEADRVLLHEPQAPRLVSLHDARTGRRLRTFAGQDGFQVVDALLLADGSVALTEVAGGATRLRLAREDREDRLVALPDGLAVLGGELPGGLLSLGHYAQRSGPAYSSRRAPRETLFLSLDTGELRDRRPDLRPALRWGPLAAGLQAESPATQLFLTDADDLLRFDPATGERRVVLKAAPAP